MKAHSGAPLSLHSLWLGSAAGQVLQCFDSSVLSPLECAPCVQSQWVSQAAPRCATGSISRWRGSLYVCCVTLLSLLVLATGSMAGDVPVSCTLAREPGWKSLWSFMFRGNIGNGTHQSFGPRWFPGELSWSLTFPMQCLSFAY